MRELKKIDVLLNEKTGETFNRDEIVKISMIGTYRRKYIGRIEWIETLELTIDVSEEYKNKTVKLKFDEISNIEKYKK